MQSLDSLRDDIRRSSGGGFAFLLANGLGWLAAGVIGLALGTQAGAWALLFQGGVTLPLAFALERAFGYPRLSKDNPLLPLVVQLAFTQVVALPAVILMLQFNPAYLPVAFAAVVGGHFLPYAWLQRTRTYIVLAALVGVGPWLAVMVGGRGLLPFVPFGVAALIIGGGLRMRAETSAS